jgi:hypothetical protein
MNNVVEYKMEFRFLDPQLLVNRVRPNPTYLLAQNATIWEEGHGRYHLTGVELKTFTFSKGPQSLSIENAVLGSMPNRLLFTRVKNPDILGSVVTTPFLFRHNNMMYFALYANGKQIPSGGLHFNMGHEIRL